MKPFLMQILILISLALMTCQANRFDNQVFSYSDFGCPFGMCRHNENPKKTMRPPSSVQTFRRARGGQQKKKMVNQVLPKIPSSACHPRVTNLECGSKDHPYGWGMF